MFQLLCFGLQTDLSDTYSFIDDKFDMFMTLKIIIFIVVELWLINLTVKSVQLICPLSVYLFTFCFINFWVFISFFIPTSVEIKPVCNHKILCLSCMMICVYVYVCAAVLTFVFNNLSSY